MNLQTICGTNQLSILRQGPKHLIPKPSCYPITSVMGLKMMRHVMSSQLLSIFPFQAEVVQNIMRHIIEDIAHQKTCKYAINEERCPNNLANQQPKQTIKNCRHGDAHHRRHNQTRFNPGFIVVYTMHQEQKAIHTRCCGLWFEMKQKAV